MYLQELYDEYGGLDDYDEETDNYNNGIYIDTENLPVMRLLAPINAVHCGIYGRSFAYYSLKERLPVILTKIIDYLAREGSRIMAKYRAPQDELNSFMQTVTKLKNDLVTNKEYEPFTYDSDECKQWNRWIEALDNKKYFLNSWMFTECYVYRKLREGCEKTDMLQDFDYFEEQKNRAFKNNEEIMCLVADRVVEMVKPSEKDQRKADFVTLLKICLWANKCDLSLSLGSEVDIIKAAAAETERLRLNPPPPPPPPKGKKAKKAVAPAGPIIISPDPFKMILEMKDKVVVDECNKIADQVQKKAEKMLEKITAAQEALVFKAQCSCNKVAKSFGVAICEPPPAPEPEPEPPGSKQGSKQGSKPGTGDNSIVKIPCPAKITVPSAVFFDIVTDNAGYELFADLCLAHFLVGQKIIQKVRFHVKNMPWFVSDVTVKDFHFLIDSCVHSSFSALSSTGATEGENNDPKVVSADNLRALGEQWKKFVDDGIFIILSDAFWTYPKCFKEMKKTDYYLYRKLQTGVACLFKGDLNYRKLVGDVNCNPSLAFQAAIGEFKPAPVIAIRTVKAETICGLKGKVKAKVDNISNINPQWMQTGNYGVIQFAGKGEALKVADRPCMDYCTTCFGIICPEHFDL